MIQHKRKHEKHVFLLLALTMSVFLTGFKASEISLVAESKSMSTATRADESSPESTSESAGDESQNDIEPSLNEDDAQDVMVSLEDGKSANGDMANEDSESLGPSQRNSVNMLNYMTTLTQRVNANKKNQLTLDSVYNSFDNLFPNSVDSKTQAQITHLMNTIQAYRMLSVKRERLEYIYEQNRARAFREAIPNPVGLLSAVQSGNALQAAASVLYMAVDSVSSYQAATSAADEQYVKGGWELDDAEAKELHDSILAEQDYMLEMVRNYDIPGDYTLSREAVDNFVAWSRKKDSELERKIAWLESSSSSKVYSEFGPYWLELAKDYYNYGDFGKCLEAVRRYESISTRIFRKDTDYATILPMAIISAKESLEKSEYVDVATKYCDVILANTDGDDWELRYFVCQIYMDLFTATNNRAFLDDAYEVARENVVVLVDEQKDLNKTYLKTYDELKLDVPPIGAPWEDAETKEKREYNKALEEERRIALPPVSEALYLNSDLLFALADKRGVDNAEKQKLENILHSGGKPIFLTEALDSRFWFDGPENAVKSEDINVEFDGKSFKIPASCVADRSTITAAVEGSGVKAAFDDWSVKEVDRKDSKKCSEFMVTYESGGAKGHEYKVGDVVVIKVTPVVESPDEVIEFKYEAVATKNFAFFDGIAFERAK